MGTFEYILIAIVAISILCLIYVFLLLNKCKNKNYTFSTPPQFCPTPPPQFCPTSPPQSTGTPPPCGTPRPCGTSPPCVTSPPQSCTDNLLGTRKSESPAVWRAPYESEFRRFANLGTWSIGNNGTATCNTLCSSPTFNSDSSRRNCIISYNINDGTFRTCNDPLYSGSWECLCSP